LLVLPNNASIMARTARASVGGVCYHVLNRGNAGMRIFHKNADYKAFIEMFRQGQERLPMRILGYCLMPTHFHLLLWPFNDGDLSCWMQWLMTTHVRRYHRHYQSSGHVWQGRFKAFPIQRNDYFLTALRYIERNALNANLVRRAQNWPWSSLYLRQNPTSSQTQPLLTHSPLQLPSNWANLVNKPMHQKELDPIQHSIKRGTPYGNPIWQKRTADKLGLNSTLNPRGRPKNRE